MDYANKLLSIKAEYHGAIVQGFDHEAAVRLAMQRADDLGVEITQEILGIMIE